MAWCCSWPLLVLLLSVTSRGAQSSPGAIDFSVVDAHVHIMQTTNGLNYTWAADPNTLTPPQQCPCAPPCACNRSLTGYQRSSSSSWKVEKVVFCEVAVAAEQWLQEARWVQTQHPGLIGAIIAQPPPGFGSGPVSSYEGLLDAAAAEIELLRGLRPQPLVLNLSTVAARQAMEEAGKRGLVIDFTLEEVALDGSIFKALLELIADTPNTSYVIEHLANPPGTNTSATALSAWADALHKLAALPNVACLQLGGEVTLWQGQGRVNHTAVASQLQAAIDIFGFDRICFEGNWFFNNWAPPHARLDLYGEWATILLDVLEQRGASMPEKRKVLRENAARIYSIALAT